MTQAGNPPISRRITYVSKGGSSGHHSEYDRLFRAALAPFDISLDQVSEPRFAANAKAPLFYSFFDTEPAHTIAALSRATMRSLLGRSTVGLFFRPGDCFVAGSLKAAIRRILFRFVSHLPHVHILSILPVDISARWDEVATGWIYDPQLWDLDYLGAVPREPSRPIADALQEFRRGRRLIVALGAQNRAKGFDYLVDVWCASPQLRQTHLFVVAGKVDERSSPQAKQFVESGGVLIDRHVSNGDLFHLYGEANMVWSCYAKDYNQSSGIHGRAIQLGIPVLVREGSYIDSLGKLLSYPSLPLSANAPDAAASQIIAWQPLPVDAGPRKELASKMKVRSLSVLVNALGLTSTAHNG
jgi:hypothetical protein